MFAIGGYDTSLKNATNMLQIYNILTDEWVLGTIMNYPRVYHMCSYSNVTQSVYVFGGTNIWHDDITKSPTTNATVELIESYNPLTDKWTIISPATTIAETQTYFAGTAVPFNEFLLIFPIMTNGAQEEQQRVIIFDVVKETLFEGNYTCPWIDSVITFSTKREYDNTTLYSIDSSNDSYNINVGYVSYFTIYDTIENISDSNDKPPITTTTTTTSTRTTSISSGSNGIGKKEANELFAMWLLIAGGSFAGLCVTFGLGLIFIPKWREMGKNSRPRMGGTEINIDGEASNMNPSANSKSDNIAQAAHVYGNSLNLNDAINLRLSHANNNRSANNFDSNTNSNNMNYNHNSNSNTNPQSDSVNPAIFLMQMQVQQMQIQMQNLQRVHQAKIGQLEQQNAQLQLLAKQQQHQQQQAIIPINEEQFAKIKEVNINQMITPAGDSSSESSKDGDVETTTNVLPFGESQVNNDKKAKKKQEKKLQAKKHTNDQEIGNELMKIVHATDTNAKI